MYENEMYDDVNDIDDDIQKRKELLEQLKNVPESDDWSENNKIYSDLNRQWKRIYYWESAYEDELINEFDSIMDAFYGKRREGFQSNQAVKEDLIKQAEALMKSENLKEATKVCNDLMAQWKSVGSSGREVDEQLWDKFRTARQAFFDRKQKHWEELQVKFETAHKVKDALIEEAASYVNRDDWSEASDAFKDLMTKWKEAGSAGREFEDALWNAFNKHRQAFYERREVYYGQMRDEQDQKYEQKRGLVEQAKAIATNRIYTKENTATMRDLGSAWKTIGNCGKEREDQIWNEFRGVMDIYFNGLKEYNENKHTQWHQKMVDARTRKQEMIQNQKRQIQYMQNEIIGLLGQRAIDEMEEDIKDAQAFINELEAEIADIDKTLEKDNK